jgi:hypothetical protein
MSLKRKANEWYNTHLLHPGETHLELTLKQHFTFVGLKPMCVKVYKACQVCRTLKKSNKNYGELPPKQNPELIPWHTLLCVDLIRPYPFGKVDKKRNINTYTELWCITMIDPATGWFEITEIPTKQAYFIANLLELSSIGSLTTLGLPRFRWIEVESSKPKCKQLSKMNTGSLSKGSPPGIRSQIPSSNGYIKS